MMLNAILLVEGYSRYLIETNNIILANKTPLACSIINEHSRLLSLSPLIRDVSREKLVGKDVIFLFRVVQAQPCLKFRSTNGTILSKRMSCARADKHTGSKPILRSRNCFHSLVVKCSRPRVRSSRTFRVESCIGRNDVMPNGRPAFSRAIAASYSN